jgi:uroporphyrinogen decarboxylase
MNKVPGNPENERRIEVAWRHGLTDRVPVDFGMADQCDFLGGWLGFDRRQYHLNPAVMLDAQLAFRKRFRGLGIIGPNYGAVVEPSLFGLKIIFPRDNPPWSVPAMKDPDDLGEYLRAWEAPDPAFAGILPLVYQTFYYMRDKVGDAVGAPLGVLGPWDTAAQLMETGNLCIATKLYPELVHELLRRITDTILQTTEVKREVLKPEVTSMLVAEDTVSSLSPEGFEEFVMPYTGRIFKEVGAPVNLWHCDGKLGHLVHLIPRMGVNVLVSFDPHTDLSVFKQKIGRSVALSGNIAPLAVMRYGTPGQVRAEVKRQMEIGKAGGGYLLDTGGELPNGTPPENIDALLDAAEEFGAY